MNTNFKESFEKTRVAGTIAAGALDEVAKLIKPGITRKFSLPIIEASGLESVSSSLVPISFMRSPSIFMAAFFKT